MQYNACEMLKTPYFFKTFSSCWVFSWVFCMRVFVIGIWFYFTFIDFYYLSMFWDSLLYSLAFCGNQLFKSYHNSTDWLEYDAGSECGESQYKLLTVLNPFFAFFVYLYFTFIELLQGYFLSPSFENFLDEIYSFNRSFNLYIENSLV